MKELVHKEEKRWDNKAVFYLEINLSVWFKQRRSQEWGSDQIFFKSYFLCCRKTMMLSHCMVAAMWQVAPLLTMDALFLEQGMLCKWVAAKGGSSGFQIGSTTFLLHFRWCLLHSSPPRKLLSCSEFIVSQVLFILIAPSALWGSSCAVTCVCWGRESLSALSCSSFCSWLWQAVDSLCCTGVSSAADSSL